MVSVEDILDKVQVSNTVNDHNDYFFATPFTGPSSKLLGPLRHNMTFPPMPAIVAWTKTNAFGLYRFTAMATCSQCPLLLILQALMLSLQLSLQSSITYRKRKAWSNMNQGDVS